MSTKELKVGLIQTTVAKTDALVFSDATKLIEDFQQQTAFKVVETKLKNLRAIEDEDEKKRKLAAYVDDLFNSSDADGFSKEYYTINGETKEYLTFSVMDDVDTKQQVIYETHAISKEDEHALFAGILAKWELEDAYKVVVEDIQQDVAGLKKEVEKTTSVKKM